jgi:hypothetical protein
MPKALAITGLVISVLTLILMSVDMALSPAGAPASKLVFNIGFILCAIAMGAMSYLVYREFR